MVVAMAAIGRTADTKRNFGWWTVGQLIVGAAGLAVLPRVMPVLGLRGLFFALAALFALGLMAVRTMPQGAVASATDGRSASAAPSRVLFALAGILLFYVALAGTASLDMSGRILALANLMIGCGLALGPAIVATALGTPANDSVALWVSVTGGLLSMALLLSSLRAHQRSK